MGDEDFKRVFKAGPATRRSEWASVIIYSFLLFLTLGTGAFLIADLALDIDWRSMTSEWLLVVGAPLGASLIVGYLWSRTRCRFVLALTETHVEAGRLCITYDDVDQVSLFVRDPDATGGSSTAIEITGGGKRICVRIGNSERVECAAMLRQRCHSAIFVDEGCDEHPPIAPNDKPRVARLALARFRKRAFGSAYAAIACGALAACMLYTLFVEKGSNLDAWFVFITSIAGVPLGLWQARVYFKKARWMREALSNWEKQSSEKLES